MRKIIPLQLFAVLLYLPLVADPVVPRLPTSSGNPNVYAPASTPYTPPYSYSYTEGPNIITNFYDPNAGPSAGPGLSTTPLDARFNAPLGTPWQAPTPVVPIYSGPQSVYTNTLQATGTGTVGYGSSLPTATPPKPATAPSLPPGPTSSTLARIAAKEKKLLSHYEEPTYFFPGLVRYSIDRWVGNDYLYDLPSNIGVVIELIVPPELTTMFNSEKMRDQVNAIFTDAGISPLAESIGDKPPLPFFNLVAFVVAVDDNYVLSLSGRLFEQVKLPRNNFQLSGIWQAITWEKQDLVVTSKIQMQDQLYGTAKDIAMLFANRVSYFKRQRGEQRKELKAVVVPVTTFTSPFLHPRGPCCTD